MGGAIIARIHKQYNLIVAEKDEERSQDLRKKFGVKINNVREAAHKSDIIILAVKPQDFDTVLQQIKDMSLRGVKRQSNPNKTRLLHHSVVRNDKFFISIAAGITTRYIEKKLGKVKVVRAMPNLPAQIGEGITALCAGKWASRNDLDYAIKIFNNIGRTVVVEEKHINAVTAVSGSGPAYVFLFIECLENAARAVGLNEEVSKELVLQTVKGSLSLIEKSGDDPKILRERVTSKGGTTQAAVNVLLKKKIEKIFVEALKAAQKRAGELSL